MVISLSRVSSLSSSQPPDVFSPLLYLAFLRQLCIFEDKNCKSGFQRICQTLRHRSYIPVQMTSVGVIHPRASPLPSLLPSLTPKHPSSKKLTFVSKSSHSQFYGVKLSHISPRSIPSSSLKFNICAKVNKGQAPPSFTLKDQDGRNVSLSKFKGKPVVVYFYPADETPGCTKQACAFRDSYEKFKKAGAEVVGISGDDSSSHKAFAKKYRLPFTLLSDEGNKVRKEWGVPSDLFGALPGRQTYVLDKNGLVQLIYNNQFQPEKHIDETLKLLQSL